GLRRQCGSAVVPALAHVLDVMRRTVRLRRRPGMAGRALPLRTPVTPHPPPSPGVTMQLSRTLLMACAMLLSANACANELPPIKPVAYVDLPRFMGNWYVIATIPTRFENAAY